MSTEHWQSEPDISCKCLQYYLVFCSDLISFFFLIFFFWALLSSCYVAHFVINSFENCCYRRMTNNKHSIDGITFWREKETTFCKKAKKVTRFHCFCEFLLRKILIDWGGNFAEMHLINHLTINACRTAAHDTIIKPLKQTTNICIFCLCFLFYSQNSWKLPQNHIFQLNRISRKLFSKSQKTEP